MNNKISNIQTGMFYYLICISLFLGISDAILPEISKNNTLIAMILGSILGIIPIILYLKINSIYPNLNIFEKNKVIFKKPIYNIINFSILLIHMLLLIASIRTVCLFLNSKYLQNTNYLSISMLLILTCILICFKKLNTVVRISQIMFVISIIIGTYVEISLIKFVEIDNLFPIKLNFKEIFEGIIYFASTTSLLIFPLLTINKNKINNNKKYNKIIILFYLLACLTLIIVMFFIITCFGYKFSSILRYPEYVLLKKIGFSNSELHLENILSFRWIFYMIALSNIGIYGIKKYGEIINLKKNKLFIFVLIICLICIFLSDKPFGSVTNSIYLVKKYYIYFYAIPMIIISLTIYITYLIKNKIK